MCKLNKSMGVLMNKLLNISFIIVSLLISNNVLSDESTTQKISGTLMFDYGLLPESGEGFTSEIRRARIDLKHSLNQDWAVKLQLTFDEEDQSSEIGDAYMRFSGIENMSITMGKMKEPFGLENMTSSKNITFLERSMASNAFAPGRNKGLMLSGTPGDVTWAVALMDLDSDNKEDAPYAVTGRATWAPLQTKDQTLHVGFSASLRQLNGDKFEIDERVELHNSEKIITSGKVDTDSLKLSGIEAAWVHGAFSVQSEYMSADLKALDASENSGFDGYYLQASYFLSADIRPYKKGAFSRIKPHSKEGAWELSSRYSMLNTNEASDGSTVRTSTLGVNYYYDENLRLMTNILHAQSSTDVADRDRWSGASFRLQYLF